MLKEGQVIEIIRSGRCQGERLKKEKLTVVKDYGNMVQCITQGGMTTCVSKGDLIVSGVITQSEEHEALRKEAERSYGPWHYKG